LDGAGWSVVGSLSMIGPKSAVVAVERVLFAAPPRAKTVLATAMPHDAARLELLVSKAAELGASVLQPLICRRSVAAREFDRERLMRIAQSSLELSRRKYGMRICSPAPLLDYLLAKRPCGVFGDINGESTVRLCPRIVLEQHGNRLQYIRFETTVLIGPEGGFAEEEIVAMRAAGRRLVPMSFSDGNLRVETAAIAGLVKINGV